MSTASKIAALMEKRGISQNELAHLAQISQSGLSSIVNGKVSPRVDTLMAIAQILNVSICELLSDEDTQSKNAIAIAPELASIYSGLNKDGIAELIRYGLYLSQDIRYQKEGSGAKAI